MSKDTERKDYHVNKNILNQKTFKKSFDDDDIDDTSSILDDIDDITNNANNDNDDILPKIDDSLAQRSKIVGHSANIANSNADQDDDDDDENDMPLKSQN